VTTTERDPRTDAELAEYGWLADTPVQPIGSAVTTPDYNRALSAATCLYVALAASRTEVAALREAATNLLDRMSVVYADNRYKSVWTLAYTHGDFYRDGPDWAPQEATLRAVIANMKEAS
jgi:hypothetical protein